MRICQTRNPRASRLARTCNFGRAPQLYPEAPFATVADGIGRAPDRGKDDSRTRSWRQSVAAQFAWLRRQELNHLVFEARSRNAVRLHAHDPRYAITRVSAPALGAGCATAGPIMLESGWVALHRSVRGPDCSMPWARRDVAGRSFRARRVVRAARLFDMPSNRAQSIDAARPVARQGFKIDRALHLSGVADGGQ